jgi:hypothetical protein
MFQQETNMQTIEIAAEYDFILNQRITVTAQSTVALVRHDVPNHPRPNSLSVFWALLVDGQHYDLVRHRYVVANEILMVWLREQAMRVQTAIEELRRQAFDACLQPEAPPLDLASIKARLGAAPELRPYATARGGVVLLNGSFPLDRARAAVDLVEHARSDLAALIAEVERLRALVGEL